MNRLLKVVFLLAMPVKAVEKGLPILFALFKFDFETVDQKRAGILAFGLFAFDGKL